MKMFQPINEKILIRLIEREQIGGLVLPSSMEEINEGEVVALGDGAPNQVGRVTPSVDVGDRVLWEARGSRK